MSQSKLSGQWKSTYIYGSNASNQHAIILEQTDSGVLGKSIPQSDGSLVSFDLQYDPEHHVLSGFWREETSPTGPYAGKVFHGVLQFLLNNEVTEAVGTWVGFNSRHNAVHAGEWTLRRQQGADL